MSEDEAIRQTREWWDKRAGEVEELADVVGVGRYDLEAASVKFIEDTVVRMLSSAQEKNICLDGGCGVGLAFPIISRVFPRIIGLDFSAKVIRRIPTSYRDSGDLALCNGSITAIPLKDNSMDAIHCRDLLQCLPASEVRPMFIEFARVLKPGGVSVVHFKNSAHMLHRLALAAGRIKRLGRPVSPAPDPVDAEIYVPGDTYLRPWDWYLEQARRAGLTVERQFSWQLFFWGRLEKRRIARPMERLERVVRKIPITNSLIRNDGINYYMLHRKGS